MKNFLYLIISSLLILAACEKNSTEPKNEEPAAVEADYYAVQTSETMTMDGVAKEAVWADAEWANIDQWWLGDNVNSSDFSGRYKFVWDENKLYILAEIIDNTLSDTHTDPFQNYWDDDCLEIFLDEDGSGGDHRYNYNAFAYHIALDGKAIDLGTNQQPVDLSAHIQIGRVSTGAKHTWEVAFDIYNQLYVHGGASTPVKLTKDKVMGYAVAYCDADGQGHRESFYGSIAIAGQDKNLAWQNASVFGSIALE